MLSTFEETVRISSDFGLALGGPRFGCSDACGSRWTLATGLAVRRWGRSGKVVMGAVRSEGRDHECFLVEDLR